MSTERAGLPRQVREQLQAWKDEGQRLGALPEESKARAPRRRLPPVAERPAPVPASVEQAVRMQEARETLTRRGYGWLFGESA